MYSASVDEAATVGCCFALQDIADLPSRNTYPDTEQQVSVSHPQSESAYVISSLGLLRWSPMVSR